MKKVVLFFCCLSLLIFSSTSPVQAATLTWDGQGHDNNWSTALNWTTNTVPGAGDAVVFSNTSVKDSTVDATFSGTVTSVSINSGYTGTINLARSLTTTSTFTQATGTFNSEGFDTRYGSTFTLSGGTYTASSNIATFSGNFTHSAGTFSHNSGTVSLDGSLQILSGSTAFYNFSKIGSNNDWLTFPSGVISTVSGTLTLRGTAPNNSLTLRASTESVQWYLDTSGNWDFYFLNVKDSNNINPTTITTQGEMVSDLGNNTNWNIVSNVQTGTQTGSIHDTANIDNWNIRMSGATSSSFVGNIAYGINLDTTNSQKGLVLGVSSADFNSQTNSGSVYVISEEVMSNYQGRGAALDLADPANFLVRFDGAAASDTFGASVNVADINNNGRDDIIVSATGTDYNSRSGSGSVYILLDSLLSSYSGTGNTVNMASSSSYNLRIDGRAASNSLGNQTVTTHDLNGSGVQDLLFNAYNYTGSNDAFYILYNSLLQPLLGTTGTTLDLLDPSSYNVVYSPGCSAMGKIGFPDYDGDGQVDIAVSGSQTFCGSGVQRIIGAVYLINHNLYSSYTGTGNFIDLSLTSNYNFRLLGSSREGSFGTSLATADYDSDQKDDLAVGAASVDYEGRVSNGSAFVIYASLLNQYSGTGNTLNVGADENFNIRFDGAAASDVFGIAVVNADFDGNGKPDLFIGGYGTDYNSRNFSGSAYLFNNDLFTRFTTRGTILDLSNFTNFSARYDGSMTVSLLGQMVNFEDINGDGRLDMLMGATQEANYGRNNSGAVYLIYNFPHTVTINSFSQTNSQTPSFSGGVNLSPLATTTVSNVQFAVDSNNPLGGWTDCDVSGTNYTCQVNQSLSFGPHTIFVRAQDDNGAYTLPSAYVSFNFTVGDGGGSSQSNSNNNTLPNYAKPVTVGPHHQGPIGADGIISLTGVSTNPGIGGIILNDTSSNDLYINPSEVPFPNLASSKVALPWAQGWNIFSPVYNFTAVSAFNGYPITTADNPYTIIVSYDPSKITNLNLKSLKIIYWDSVSLRWKALPGPYIVNEANKTIATTTKVFAYFAVGYPSGQNQEKDSLVLGKASEGPSPAPSEPAAVNSPSETTNIPTLKSEVTNATSQKTCFLFICW